MIVWICIKSNPLVRGIFFYFTALLNMSYRKSYRVIDNVYAFCLNVHCDEWDIYLTCNQSDVPCSLCCPILEDMDLVVRKLSFLDFGLSSVIDKMCDLGIDDRWTLLA